LSEMELYYPAALDCFGLHLISVVKVRSYIFTGPKDDEICIRVIGMHQGKIVFIVRNFPPEVGGIGQFMYDIASALPPDQFQIIGFPVSGWEVFDTQQVFEITRLGIPPRWIPLFDKKIRLLLPFYFYSLLRAKKMGLLVCMQANITFLSVAWLIRWIRGIPYGVFLHGYDVMYPQTRNIVYRSLYNALLRTAQFVFPNGRTTESVAHKVGVDTDKIHVIYPCVNPSKLVAQTPQEELRKRYGLVEKRCILTVGRLVKRKGYDLVIRALPEILKMIPEAHYLVVGGGDMDYLSTLVTELKLDDHVTFVGPKSHAEVMDFYSICDVFVMITRELEKGDIESFGIVYLEANYFAKPVVAGRAGGVEDAVVHGKTGILVDSQDPKDVSAVIIRIMNDFELSEKLGEAGKIRVSEHFTNIAAARNLLSALSQD
jgi:phosphatidylinositol alpha-1,6-mannosyltransferase